jgi:hypothetical protein
LALAGLGIVAGAFFLGRLSVAPGSAGSALGGTGQGNFLGDMAAAAQKTIGGLFGGTEQKPVLEIDLVSRRAVSSSSAAQPAGAVKTVAGSAVSVATQPKAPAPSVGTREAAAAASAGLPATASRALQAGAAESPATAAASTTGGGEAGTAASAQPAAGRPCEFSGGGIPSRRVIVNEIAWMGSPARSGETDTQAAGNEWLELKNVSDGTVPVGSWRLIDRDGRMKIVLDSGMSVALRSFFLLERTDDASVPGVTADAIYGGALSNDGAWLRLFDEQCMLVDEVDASAGWPGGDNGMKQTLERNADGFGWHTSAAPGGTPRAENSAPVPAAAEPLVKHSLGVSLAGDGSGIVTSEPAGMHCTPTCVWNYAPGTAVTLAASSSADSKFDGWSGACTGKKATCAIRLTTPTSVIATFYLVNPPAQSAPPPTAPSPEASSTAPSPEATSSAPTPPPGPSVPDHIVIAAVQITGGPGKTTNDFVKIFNPFSTPFNLRGYRLVKRITTSTTDSSLKSWGNEDAIISAGGYYTWANSSFTSLVPPADATTGSSISDNTGIAIREGSENTGRIVDALAWENAQNAFVEGSAFQPPSGKFEANQVLTRKTVNGVVQDTDDNSNDFVIE